MTSRPDRAIRGGYFAPRDRFVNGRPRRPCAPWRPSNGSYRGPGDTFAVQSLGDVGEGLAFREHRPDLRPPSIVPVVTPDVGQPNVFGDEVPAGRLKDRIVVGRGRPLGARRGDRIERAAPLVVVALRHLAPQGEELAALGHLDEDASHTERTELVRDRAIRAAATSCCLRHRVTLPRVGLTVKSEAGQGRLHRRFGRWDVGVQVPHAGSATWAHAALLPLPQRDSEVIQSSLPRCRSKPVAVWRLAPAAV